MNPPTYYNSFCKKLLSHIFRGLLFFSTKTNIVITESQEMLNTEMQPADIIKGPFICSVYLGVKFDL